MMQDHKVAIDGVVAAGAITLPWWAVGLNEWASLGLTLVGLAIGIVRLIMMYREWKEGK
jgi:hypothetical protein